MVNGITGAEHGFSILYMCIIENFFPTGKNWCSQDELDYMLTDSVLKFDA